MWFESWQSMHLLYCFDFLLCLIYTATETGDSDIYACSYLSCRGDWVSQRPFWLLPIVNGYMYLWKDIICHVVWIVALISIVEGESSNKVDCYIRANLFLPAFPRNRA